METELTQAEIDDLAKEIEVMGHYQMCKLWRFGDSRKGYFRKDFITSTGKSLGDLFSDRLFKDFGGFTPQISKQLGWKIK